MSKRGSLRENPEQQSECQLSARRLEKSKGYKGSAARRLERRVNADPGEEAPKWRSFLRGCWCSRASGCGAASGLQVSGAKAGARVDTGVRAGGRCCFRKALGRLL